jgi:hypothetical protein
MKPTLILLLTLFTFDSAHATSGISKQYKLKFRTECSVFAQKAFNMSVVLKLRGKKTEKFYSVSCNQDQKKCVGAELYLSDEIVGPLDLNPQIFAPQSINATSTTASAIFNNVTLTIDMTSKTARIVEDFSDRKDDTKEQIWEGSCN